LLLRLQTTYVLLYMKKVFRITGLSLLALLIIMQFYRPARNESATVPTSDIITAYAVPDNVAVILKKACYDCHSSNTHYPWYANIQPVSMWLEHHIDEGKDELNFSEFGNFTTKRKLKKLREIVDEVEEGEMPLSSYTLIHKEAVLTEQEKQLLTDWAKGLTQKITLEEGASVQPKQ